MLWYVTWVFLAPALAVLLAALVGVSPTKARVGPEGLAAMSLACGLSVLATVLGSVPVAWAALRSPKYVKNLGYGASLFRLVILTLLAVIAAVLVDLQLRTFLLWLGISYLVALCAEVVFLVLLIRKAEALN
jgi:hypothetical protein